MRAFILAKTPEQEKVVEDIAKQSETPMPTSSMLLLIAYLVIGTIVCGNWRTMDSGKRFVTFLLLPVHCIAMWILGGMIGGIKGVAQEEDVRTIGTGIFKLLMWGVIIAAVIACYMMGQP